MAVVPILPISVLMLSFLLFATRSTVSANNSAVVPLVSTNYGTSVSVEVGIGDSTFHVLPDTGSADLWVFGESESPCPGTF